MCADGVGRGSSSCSLQMWTTRPWHWQDLVVGRLGFKSWLVGKGGAGFHVRASSRGQPFLRTGTTSVLLAAGKLVSCMFFLSSLSFSLISLSPCSPGRNFAFRHDREDGRRAGNFHARGRDSVVTCRHGSWATHRDPRDVHDSWVPVRPVLSRGRLQRLLPDAHLPPPPPLAEEHGRPQIYIGQVGV